MAAVGQRELDHLTRRDREGTRVDIVTPEGVPLPFTVALLGDRAAAFLLDLLIIVTVVGAVAILTALAVDASAWLWAFAGLITFLLSNFYFAWFEIRWHGATPGKRLTGIRVIAAAGGPLTAEAVLARNLTRDVEVFLPLAAILQPGLLWPGASGLGRFAAIAWVLVLALLPLFNRYRLRVGDLVGGTLVVRAPRAVLLPDVGGAAVSRPASEPTPAFSFTEAELAVYGIYELQVLEALLRRTESAVTAADQATLDAVAAKVQAKIGRDLVQSGPLDSRHFLEAFYAAQRARLERGLLFGKRKEDKYSG